MKMRNLQLTSIEKKPLVRFIPTSKVLYLKHKIDLIKSLLFRCFSLCSDFIKFHYEIDELKSILYKNSYPQDLIDKCIKEFLDKIMAPKPVVSTVPKKDLLIVLPYLRKLSLQIHTRINHIMENKLPYCNV